MTIDPPVIVPLRGVLHVASNVLSGVFNADSALDPVTGLVTVAEATLQLVTITTVVHVPTTTAIPGVDDITPPDARSKVDRGGYPAAKGGPGADETPTAG